MNEYKRIEEGLKGQLGDILGIECGRIDADLRKVGKEQVQGAERVNIIEKELKSLNKKWDLLRESRRTIEEE
jgi:hypothetical protein